MKGSRNRKVWICRACAGKKLLSRRAWASHLWDKHHIALLRHFRRRGAYKEGAINERRGQAA